ncbi:MULTISPECIES: hypothetical protein [Lactococcus]|jgi:hypothetical protein|uniref:Phage protein n=1 Tax=Lactococcus lactis TaxID=1358 RepID=A0AAW5TN78_9LACT|nr:MULTISPECIES: hypothetical protein [Lactococcus]AUS69966.1 hypothetical protein LLG50_07755 [Lactococcus lactis subsp. lactis]MBK0029220.1 hypothetical protein [Lactococcus sp. S47]MCC4120182.1 hypothetical protein [Lactococcus lactis]MCG1000339.1 hypothetical protein [Lactococcus lactis]MCT0449248.1 hypothetical protein [Lactococcus lactis subsp. lactis]
MNLDNFDERFNDFLERFDNTFEKEEPYEDIVKIVNSSKLNASEFEKALAIEHLIAQKRTNNLVKLALKEFLKKD